MAKKYLSVSIMMLAPICANASGDYTAAIQQLDAEIARLQAQNQADLEELQECEKKVKGFKISGITTLSLTGVGIGVNIGEAVKLNKLEQQSSALDTSIAEKQRQKEAEEAAERERQAAEQKQKEEAEREKQEEEQKQEAEAQQQQSQQPVPVKEKSGNEEDKSAKKVTDTKPAEKKTTKKTSTPASKSGTQKTNQPTAKSSAAKDKKSVKEFLLSKVDVDGTDMEYWSFDGTKSSTTQYVQKMGDWAAIYGYGVITGVAKCSTTNGQDDTPGDPQGDTGQYCWCKMTQLKKTEETNFLLVESRWVFHYEDVSASDCASDCANGCGGGARNDSSHRGGMFGSVE